MNEIFITDASAVFAEKLTLDETIIKGDKFYFGKLEEDFEPIANERYDLRCNRILKYLVDKLDLSRFKKDEIAIVIGTTNSGIEEFETTENKHHAELGNPAEFLKWYLGTTNYSACVSTACTSGAKAFSTARKLLQNGVCKAVIAGGIDTLASMPSYGFHALEVLSHEKTNPFSKNRDGISLGEGGALFVVTKATERDLEARQSSSLLGREIERGVESNKAELDAKSITEAAKCALLLGIGETSDAYHSATPDPDGTQAVNAIQLALKDANLKPEDIDYINLHGTGTISNDLMEANAIYKVFGDKVPASSTKPLTGHCLGAAASIEAFICYQILKGERNLPIHKFDGKYDENLPKINLVNEKTPQKNIKTCMSTSFGFGGTNAVMILSTKFLDVKTPRGEDAKSITNIEARQSSSLLGREIERGVESNKADLEAKSVSETAGQLRSEADKRNILISPLEGEKKFLSELCKLRNFREGYKKYKYSDRATECAMTNVGDDFEKIDYAKIARHSEDNNNFIPKNLTTKNQEDLSLTYQDDETTSLETDQASLHLDILVSKNLTASLPSYPAVSCLPHSTPMVLIDDVLNVDMENQIVKASVKIHKDKIFFDKEINGISPLVGIEFMAQTIGCYAYFKANHKNFGSNIKNLTKEAFSQIEKKPSIGFLLGTRLYENSLEKFENEKTYIITAQEIYGDDELVSFECLIYNEKEDNNPENYIAKATINAFQPNDVEKYIKELE